MIHGNSHEILQQCCVSFDAKNRENGTGSISSTKARARTCLFEATASSVLELRYRQSRFQWSTLNLFSETPNMMQFLRAHRDQVVDKNSKQPRRPHFHASIVTISRRDYQVKRKTKSHLVCPRHVSILSGNCWSRFPGSKPAVGGVNQLLL